MRAVRWSGLALGDAELAALVRAALGSELAGATAGGAGSGRSDAALCAELAAAGDPPALFVKAWEPPLDRTAGPPAGPAEDRSGSACRYGVGRKQAMSYCETTCPLPDWNPPVLSRLA